MRIIIFISIFIFSSFTNAAEGHRWMKLDYTSKAIIIATYENGKLEGCGEGVRLSTSELFADSKDQIQHSIKLVMKCPSKIVTTAGAMEKVIAIIDNGYAKPGAANINIGTMIVNALETYTSGLTQFEESKLKQLISISS